MENQLAYLIPIIAIVGGITYAIFYQYFRTKRHIAEARTPVALAEEVRVREASNATTAERLEGVEARLAALEKSNAHIG